MYELKLSKIKPFTLPVFKPQGLNNMIRAAMMHELLTIPSILQPQSNTMFLPSDNFDDNVKGDQWTFLNKNATSVAETGGKVQVDLPLTSSYGGYVSTVSYNFNKSDCQVWADVNNALRAGVEISLQQVTDNTPAGNDDWYRIMITKDEVYFIQRKVVGVLTTLVNSTPLVGLQHTLRIVISGGNIEFFLDGVSVFSEAYALSSYDCFYYFNSEYNDENVSTSYYDNFVNNGI